MIRRHDIVTEARTWANTRWHHQASRKGVGCDCIGLVVGVARELGIPGGLEFGGDLAVRGYGREPDPAMLLAACRRYLDPLELEAAQPADILLFRCSGQPRHFGLLSERGPDRVIHAYAQARKVVENGLNEAWRARIVSAWSYRGLDG